MKENTKPEQMSYTVRSLAGDADWRAGAQDAALDSHTNDNRVLAVEDVFGEQAKLDGVDGLVLGDLLDVASVLKVRPKK